MPVITVRDIYGKKYCCDLVIFEDKKVHLRIDGYGSVNILDADEILMIRRYKPEADTKPTQKESATTLKDLAE